MERWKQTLLTSRHNQILLSEKCRFCLEKSFITFHRQRSRFRAAKGLGYCVFLETLEFKNQHHLPLVTASLCPRHFLFIQVNKHQWCSWLCFFGNPKIFDSFSGKCFSSKKFAWKRFWTLTSSVYLAFFEKANYFGLTLTYLHTSSRISLKRKGLMRKSTAPNSLATLRSWA